VGPGDLAPQVQRALDLGAAIPDWPERALDLGSGGGLPGLPLALAHPRVEWVLLEGSTRRSEFLRHAVESLQIGERVRVIAERAEVAGHGPLRGSFQLVLSRSFGPPAVTAECGAPLLAPGGRLVVAEPTGGQPDRWPTDGLAQLGLTLGPGLTDPLAVQILVQSTACPTRYPRRTGIPTKRPLF
jgi:16S rRNA (guanine527-N7)-methyltransferase